MGQMILYTETQADTTINGSDGTWFVKSTEIILSTAVTYTQQVLWVVISLLCKKTKAPQRTIAVASKP